MGSWKFEQPTVEKCRQQASKCREIAKHKSGGERELFLRQAFAWDVEAAAREDYDGANGQDRWEWEWQEFPPSDR